MKVDETWIHLHTAEIKEQSKQWLHPANLLRRMRRLSHRLESWWVPFSGIPKAWSTSITWDEQNNHRTSLCQIIVPIRIHIGEKITSFNEEKSDLLPWQRTNSRFHRRHGLRTAIPSTVSSRFGTLGLLFVS